MTSPRLVIFDVDGTLIDSQAHIQASMRCAFEAAGLPPPAPAEVLSIVGLSLPQAIALLRPDLTDTGLATVVQNYKSSFMGLREEGRAEAASPLYPGAREALDCLHSNPAMLLGVATGKSRRGLEKVMEGHALAPYFVTTQTADDHPSKPHPSMVTQALADVGAGSVDGVMIGDTSFDIEMGRAAGVRTIGVSWGYHGPEALRRAGADLLIDHFDQLGDALASLWPVRT